MIVFASSCVVGRDGQEGSTAVDLTTEALIERLREADVPEDWRTDYYLRVQLSSFPPVEAAIRQRGLHVGLRKMGHPLVPDPEVRLVMKELMARGIEALPLLLSHFDDNRPTRFRIKPIPLRGFVVSDGLDENVPTNQILRSLPITSRSFAGEVFVPSVGDLCYVIVGEIVNRSYSVVSPEFTTCLAGPSLVTNAARAISQRWCNLTGKQHRALLLNDLMHPDHIDRRIGAYQRLAFYYPDTLESNVVGILQKPTCEGKSIDEAMSRGQMAAFITCMVLDDSKVIDGAVYRLFAASPKDRRVVEACVGRLIGKGYEDVDEEWRRLKNVSGAYGLRTNEMTR